jgi:hypothetical protein
VARSFSPETLTALEGWLRGHRRQVGAAVVLLSAAVRVVCFLQLASGPCLEQHRWDQSDMAFYDQWARTVAAGDVLADRPLFPTHTWHEQVARAFCLDYPERVAALQARVGEEGIPTLTQAVWNHWLGEKTFYQDPLYPYLVAATYAVGGADVNWVLAWQMALGAASNLLVYLLARDLFGELAGLAGGLLAVLCPIPLYYEMLLLRESCLVFATLGLLYLTAVVRHRPTPGWLFLAGACFGAAMLLKSSTALYFLAAAPALVLAGRPAARTGLLRAAALAAGGALALAPAVGRNLAVGAPPLTLASSGPLTFANCNAADNPNQSGFYASGRLHAILEDSGGHWLSVLRETLQTHDGVGSYLTGMERRFLSLWHWYEMPDNSNFYYYRLQAPILWLPATFVVLGPLGAVGVALACLGRRGRGSPPGGPEGSAEATEALRSGNVRLAVVLVLICLVTPLLFGSSSRLRLPLEAALMPFAGLTLSSVTWWLAERRLGPAGLTGAAVLLLALAIGRPLPPGERLIRVTDYQVAHRYYQPRLDEARKQGDSRRLKVLLEQYVATEPPELSTLSASDPPHDEDEERLAQHFAQVHLWYADALRALGRDREASGQTQDARRLLHALSAKKGK